MKGPGIEKQNPSRGARRLPPSRRFKLQSLGVASNETCLLKVGSFPAHAPNVIAMLSGKQTHSEGQCRQWSAVYYTGGSKAESPLRQGSQPAFVKIFYILCVRVQTHHPKSLEAYKGRVNTITITPSFTCYVFKQLIINKPAVTFQPVNNR